ncbi:lysoplasmalogenase [Aliiglaciecola sp. LCG003]|uniref:lysoplasmalogenase n=1 Tax=Aliiglaciecola sp. LCG003 TaxID=3053655 RepID=UPI002573FB8C|nr:lysoplasmalogenase [Aliiglaciecola sp. LCG003]WJG07615.1 lysoplasmalogenase [Aliiglaciecola sp. LCG003]
MIITRISFPFTILALTYIATLSFSPYDYQPMVKILPILVLLLTCLTILKGRLRVLMAIAITASGVGDVLLSLSFTNSFVYGLGAFLSAHLVYTTTFFLYRNKQMKISAWRKLSAVMLISFGLLMGAYILPDAGDLLVPVSFYLCVIASMAVTALLSQLPISVSIGAAVFMLSDTFIAINMFKQPLLASGYIVMITYYLAQYLIVMGIVTFANTPQIKRDLAQQDLNEVIL